MNVLTFVFGILIMVYSIILFRKVNVSNKRTFRLKSKIAKSIGYRGGKLSKQHKETSKNLKYLGTIFGILLGAFLILISFGIF